MEFMMAFRYSRPAMTGAAIFTLAGVTVLPLAQANAAPASPQDEARSGATQGQPNSAAQKGQDQGQQQGANASGQNQDGATQDQQQSANANGQGRQQGANADAQGQQGANASGQNQDGATQGGATQDPSKAASGGEQQQAQPSASQDQQGTNASGQSQQQSANGQGQQAQGQQQGASASQSSSNSNSASQNNQSRHSQPSAPANQNSGFIAITSVDGFIDPQNTDNVLSVETTGIDNTHRVQYEPRVQELDEFGNIVNDDVSNGGGSSLGSDGSFGMYVSVDGTKINPNHHYRVYIDAFDRDTLTASYAYYPVVVWNRTYIPVVPLSAAR
ncbi:protein argonaute-2 [Rothia sp. HMSC058E10]|uniref:protein argonaute-2 n=1 Tax=Rothia sp. HMSC058E10 TaxID=1715088 RepID=UPI0008A4AF88|nr:protein argonaute-2 [Rothia sp. HMSC058E10]